MKTIVIILLMDLNLLKYFLPVCVLRMNPQMYTMAEVQRSTLLSEAVFFNSIIKEIRKYFLYTFFTVTIR